ncbi:MAG: minor capsid protein [Turicibacter sp.]|nr:minor capsid protein [Turicibacter sp.]
MKLKVDARALIHEIAYEAFKGKDRWGEETFGEPVRVENCRVDLAGVYQHTGSERKLVAKGIVFCYASATVPFLEFKEQSKVSFNGEAFVIVKAIPVYEPWQNTLFGYELEVV